MRPVDSKVVLSKVIVNGYYVVDLAPGKGGAQLQIGSTSVSRMVATTFLPNPQGLPVVHHKNGNRLENGVDNLEWLSYQDNSRLY